MKFWSKIHLFVSAIFLGTLLGGYALAADSLSFVECEVTPAKQKIPAKPGSPLFNLHLKLRSKLESKSFAFLRVAVDTKEAGKFKTIEEKRIQKGSEVSQFNIPLYEWVPPKMSVFVLIQPKNPQPGETPLANSTKIIERPSAKQ